MRDKKDDEKSKRLTEGDTERVAVHKGRKGGGKINASQWSELNAAKRGKLG